jgi:4-hydroxybenzoate polyprenyltransferase
MPRVETKLRDVLTLHRLQFPLPFNYLGQAFWGASLAVGSPRGLLSPVVLLAVGTNALLIASPLALNAALDVATDRLDADKRYLATAASRLGQRRALIWPITEMICALVLSLAISGWTGMAAAIVVTQILHNVEPVHLKRRGYAGTVAFGLAATLLPGLLAYGAVRSDFDVSGWLILLGLGVMAVGRTTLWSIPDHEADLATGMRTPAVRYGCASTLVWSCVLMVTGNVLLGWGLCERYGIVWSLAGTLPYLLFLAAVVISSLGGGKPLGSARLTLRPLPIVAIADLVNASIPLLAR